MSKSINWTRLAASLVLAAPLIWLLTAQAFSIAATKQSPKLAASALSSNGLALERIAFEQSLEGVVQEKGVPSPGKEAVRTALSAVQNDPLVPKAHIVLALSQLDESQRRKILDLANSANRRDLSLQGLVLQDAILDEDYDNSIATLDRILRVHPEYGGEFFPILVQALAQEETVATFATMLDGSSTWHKGFLEFAVRQSSVRPNLALLRPNITLVDEEFDRRLIEGLARDGDIIRAVGVLESVTEGRTGFEGPRVLGWSSDYPPFDWRFVDTAGFRAQTTADGEALEVSIRPGKGGIFAERAILEPSAPLTISITHEITPVERAKDVRLELICGSNGASLLDEQFSPAQTRFSLAQLPRDCQYLKLALRARAWSGRSKLDVLLKEVRME